MVDVDKTKIKHGWPNSMMVLYNVKYMPTQAKMWHINNVTLGSHQRRCHIDMFMRGYVALHHSTTVISHYDLQWWFTTMSSLCWHNLECKTLILCHSMFIKGYVALWCLSRVTSHCDIHQGLCPIVTFVKGYVALQQFPILRNTS